MADLGPVAWPPEPIRTERLVLRESEARDRAVFIELLASPEVGTYLGGARPRDELELEVPAVPGRRPGLFVVDPGRFGWQLLSAARPSCGAPGGYKEYRAAKRFGPRHRGFVLQRSWPGMGGYRDNPAGYEATPAPAMPIDGQ